LIRSSISAKCNKQEDTMTLVIVALVLFAALVGFWLVLPGEIPASETSMEAETAGSPVAQQLV
jgi:hypothetical protein